MPRTRQRRSLSFIIAVVYALLLILTHDVFQQLALGYQRSVGIQTWNLLFMIAAICVGALFFWIVFRRSGGLQWKRPLVIHMIAVLVLGAAVMEGLMVKYVETIHYVQYALMAVLIYPIVGRVSGAVVLAIAVGMVDEWYQFTVLYPGRGALDINDCVMNTVGALSGGLIGALSNGARKKVETASVHPIGSTRVWLAGWLSACLVLFSLSFTPAVGVYADGGAVTFFKNRVTEQGLPERRLRQTGAGKHWYQLRPQEGLTLIMLLPLLFSGMDPLREPGPGTG